VTQGIFNLAYAQRAFFALTDTTFLVKSLEVVYVIDVCQKKRGYNDNIYVNEKEARIENEGVTSIKNILKGNFFVLDNGSQYNDLQFAIRVILIFFFPLLDQMARTNNCTSVTFQKLYTQGGFSAKVRRLLFFDVD
jgi:hypothetical protein